MKIPSTILTIRKKKNTTLKHQPSAWYTALKVRVIPNMLRNFYNTNKFRKNFKLNLPK